jgi:hypothetical protein
VKALSSIVAAVAAGELTPSEASELTKLIEGYVRVLETADHEERLRALEGKINDGKPYRRPCPVADLDSARLVVALKEAEHRPMVERRFPEAASRVTYWHVDDIAFADPSIALAIIDDRVDELISILEPPPA